jgi:hypothetical protein
MESEDAELADLFRELIDLVTEGKEGLWTDAGGWHVE